MSQTNRHVIDDLRDQVRGQRRWKNIYLVSAAVFAIGYGSVWVAWRNDHARIANLEDQRDTAVELMKLVVPQPVKLAHPRPRKTDNLFQLEPSR